MPFHRLRRNRILGKGADGGGINLTGVGEGNIVYNSSGAVKFLLNMRGATLDQFDADFNIFYSAGNPAGSAAFVEELKKRGGVQKTPQGKIRPHQRTAAADPLFVDPAKKDFRPIQPDDPDLVVRAIREVVDAARLHARLSPSDARK